MSNTNINKGLENPNSCPVFTGSTAGEYLVFNETWMANMRFNSVQDIILKGTHQGVKLREGCRMPVPDRFKTLCLVHNKQMSANACKRAPIYKMLVEEHPWLVYWWKSVPIPIGRPSFKDPVTGEVRLFEPVSQAELHRTLDSLPLGCDDILDRYYDLPKEIVHVEGVTPRSWHPLSLKFFPGVMNAHATDGVWANNEGNQQILGHHLMGEFVLTMTQCYAESKYLDYNALKDFVGEGEHPMKTCEAYEIELEPDAQVIVEKTYQGILTSYKALDVELNILFTKSSTVFSKIGHSALQLVIDELKVGDFHRAYRIIEETYINKGVSNIESFETAVRNVILEPGKDFTPHWVALQDSLKRLAMVSGIQRDALHHQNMQEGVYVPFVPKINSLEAIANSGVLSDREIELKFHRVLIPETTRVKILEDSIMAKIDRFSKQKESMYDLQVNERTIRTFLAKILLREESKPGQDHKIMESKGSNKLNKDESTNSKSAMITHEETIKIPRVKYPPGTCPNHPKSTSHTLAECGGLNKDDGGGNNKSNSNSNNSRNNENKYSGNKYDKNKPKRKWEDKYCKYCADNPELSQNRFSHSSEECNKRGNNLRSNNERNSSNHAPRANISRKSERRDDDANNDRGDKRTKSTDIPSGIDPEVLSYAFMHWDTIKNWIVDDQKNNGGSSSSSSSSKGRN
jgi:hypothetical protein